MTSNFWRALQGPLELHIIQVAFLNRTTVVVKVLAIGIHLTNVPSKFYIASISNRNPHDKYSGAKIDCPGIRLTQCFVAGLA